MGHMTKYSPLKKGQCKLRHTFRWKISGTCLATFQCHQLEENVCQDYGLDVYFPSTGIQDSFKTVCLEDSVILGTLETNQSVVIDMWYRPNLMNDVQADCVLWCSNRPSTRLRVGKSFHVRLRDFSYKCSVNDFSAAGWFHYQTSETWDQSTFAKYQIHLEDHKFYCTAAEERNFQV